MMERGRLRQRISRVLEASFRSSCSISSRKVAEAVQEPVFVSRRDAGNGDDVLRGLDRSRSLPPRYLDPLFHCRGHELAAGTPQLSVDCRCRPTAVKRESTKKSKKKERRVSEIGVFYEAGGDAEGRTCPPSSPVSPSYYCFKQMKEELEREERRVAAKKKKEKEREERVKGKKLLSNSYGFTSSSPEDSDNDDAGDIFSSDEGRGAPREGTSLKEPEGTEMLFSSRSFSSDSSEFYYQSSRRHSRRKKKTSQRQQKPRRGDSRRSGRHNGWDGGFRPLVSISSSSSCPYFGAARMNEAVAVLGEGGVEVGREGIAVEKQSSDPYADFRSSMLEMIVEKQLLGTGDLEHLLRCYLSLNSPSHHPIILEVFSEIWETLFSN